MIQTEWGKRDRQTDRQTDRDRAKEQVEDSPCTPQENPLTFYSGIELLPCYALLTETQLLLKRNNTNIAPSHFGFITYADDLLIALH